MMVPFCLVFLLLKISVALNLTTVYEMDDFHFILPNQSSVFLDISQIKGWYFALDRKRILLGIHHDSKEIPCSLAWLPIPTSTSTTPPQLNPYPSWELQERDNCKMIQSARGLTVDSVNRLWVLDNGNVKCPPKLWIFRLISDTVFLNHEFSTDVVNHGYGLRWLNDLVLDETEDDRFLAYISVFEEHLVVFDLNIRESWIVRTGGNTIQALALSPLKNRTHLYVSQYPSNELQTISVTDLRDEEKNVMLTAVGNKSTFSNRMTMDARGVLYFDLWTKKSVSVWNSNSPFQETVFYEDKNIYSYKHDMPFTFTLDTRGYFWLMAIYRTEHRIRILKSATVTKDRRNAIETTRLSSKEVGDSEPQESSDNAALDYQDVIILLICSNVATFTLLGIVTFWAVLRLRNKAQRLIETEQGMTGLSDCEPDDAYEIPIHSSQGTGVTTRAVPSTSDVLDRLGTPPPVPVDEYDEVGLVDEEQENCYDYVTAPVPVYFRARASDSEPYLRILPNITENQV